FRSKTAAGANDAVAEQPRLRSRQKSEARASAGEIGPFPPGPVRVFRQRGREHLHAGIEQRRMDPSFIGFSVGLANWNHSGRKPHFAKRLAMSAQQLFDALETRTVFQACVSQGPVKLRSGLAPRTSGAYFIQAKLLLAAADKLGNFHAHVAASVQGPRRISVAAV